MWSLDGELSSNFKELSKVKTCFKFALISQIVSIYILPCMSILDMIYTHTHTHIYLIDNAYNELLSIMQNATQSRQIQGSDQSGFFGDRSDWLNDFQLSRSIAWSIHMISGSIRFYGFWTFFSVHTWSKIFYIKGFSSTIEIKTYSLRSKFLKKI